MSYEGFRVETSLKSNYPGRNFVLAPHTSGPRDVPLCEALSLLQKPLHYRGYSAEIAPTLNVKLRDSVTGGGGVSQISGTARAQKFKNRRGSGRFEL